MIRYVLGSRASIGGPLGSGRGGAAAGLPVAGAVLWLDASKITGLSDGAAISTWTDSTGNGRNATQVNATYQPTYKTNIINGKPVVRFGSDDFFNLSISLPSGSWTIFGVHLGVSVTKSGYYLLDSQTGRLIIAVRSANSIDDPDIAWYDGAWRDIAAGATGWQINAWLLNSGTNTGAIFRNGASLGTAAYTATAIGGTTAIGARYDGTNQRIASDVAEIIIYDSALSVANRQAVEAYLAAKYAITLA